jgi:hypothetical protein
MKNLDWAYYAGLFDGEGSVVLAFCQRQTATKSCKKYSWVSNASLRISNNNPMAFYELEEKFGGKIHLHKNKKNHVWIVQGNLATEFAEKIIPYSRLKAEQLDVFLDFMYSKRKETTFKRLTTREINYRLRLAEELSALKHMYDSHTGNNQYTLRRIEH